MNEYKVNDYITLKLIDRETVIFVNGERYDQCKFLLFNILVKKIEDYGNIQSIDELEIRYGRQSEGKHIIDPETAFLGHCSNIQAWVEHDYDKRILHRTISFPLLKKLTDVGDLVAKKVFKEEIAQRLASGASNVFWFLVEQDYLKYLTPEETKTLLTTELLNKVISQKSGPSNSQIFPLIDRLIRQKIPENIDVIKDILIENRTIIEENTRTALPKLRKIISNPGSELKALIRKELAQRTLQKDIIRRLRQNQANNTKYIIENGYLDYLNLHDLENLLFKVNLNYPNQILDDNALMYYLKSRIDVNQIIDSIRSQEAKNFTDLELLFLMRNPLINFFYTLIRQLKIDYANSLKTRSYHYYYDDVYKLFERIHKVAPLTLSNLIVKLLERNDSEITSVLLSQNLFSKLKLEDLNYLLENHDTDVLKEVIKASNVKNLYTSGEEIEHFYDYLVKNAHVAYTNHLIWLFQTEDIETINNLIKNYILWNLDSNSFSYIIENLGSRFLKVLSIASSEVLKQRGTKSWHYMEEYKASLDDMFQKIDQTILNKCIREVFEYEDFEVISYVIRVELLEMLDPKFLKELVTDKGINFFPNFFKTLECNNWSYLGTDWNGNIFENLNKIAPDVLIKNIIQIVKNGTLHNLAVLIFSGNLVRYLGEKELSELIEDQELQFIERVLNSSKVIETWDSRETDLYFFFDALKEKAKDSLIKKSLEICKNGSESSIIGLIRTGIVYVFPPKGLEIIINDPKSNFPKVLVEYAREEGYSHLIERIAKNPENESFLRKYLLSLKRK